MTLTDSHEDSGWYSEPVPNPFRASRNVFTVNNEKDRSTPSFDDLFEDPDVQSPPVESAASWAAPPASDHEPMSDWADELDLPNFVTPPEPQAADHEINGDIGREMSNVNVIGAVTPLPDADNDPIPDAVGRASDTNAPEFVPPLDAFGTGANPVSSPAQTGRLYRSAGAEGPAAAVAIPALELANTPAEPIRISTTSGAPAPHLEAADYDDSDSKDFNSSEFADSAKSPRMTVSAATHPAGLTYSGVAVVILASTILVGFIDAFINHHLGWLTGIALIASSVYAALNVRLVDVWAPAILAPLGFMAATLTAGQLTRSSTGSWFVREGYMIFRSLAVNAPWIIGATAICAGIAIWRRRQA